MSRQAAGGMDDLRMETQAALRDAALSGGLEQALTQAFSANPPPSGGAEPRELTLDAMRNNLREAFEESAFSGQLAQALQQLQFSAPAADSQEDLHSIRTQLGDSLRAAAESGQLGEALRAVSAGLAAEDAPSAGPAAAASEPRSDFYHAVYRSGVPPQAYTAGAAAAAPARPGGAQERERPHGAGAAAADAEVEEIRSKLESVLKDAAETGELRSVVSQMVQQQDPPERGPAADAAAMDDIRLRLEESLREAAVSGGLQKALEQLNSGAGPDDGERPAEAPPAEPPAAEAAQSLDAMRQSLAACLSDTEGLAKALATISASGEAAAAGPPAEPIAEVQQAPPPPELAEVLKVRTTTLLMKALESGELDKAMEKMARTSPSSAAAAPAPVPSLLVPGGETLIPLTPREPSQVSAADAEPKEAPTQLEDLRVRILNTLETAVDDGTFEEQMQKCHTARSLPNLEESESRAASKEVVSKTKQLLEAAFEDGRLEEALRTAQATDASAPPPALTVTVAPAPPQQPRELSPKAPKSPFKAPPPGFSIDGFRNQLLSAMQDKSEAGELDDIVKSVRSEHTLAKREAEAGTPLCEMEALREKARRGFEDCFSTGRLEKFITNGGMSGPHTDEDESHARAARAARNFHEGLESGKLQQWFAEREAKLLSQQLKSRAARALLDGLASGLLGVALRSITGAPVPGAAAAPTTSSPLAQGSPAAYLMAVLSTTSRRLGALKVAVSKAQGRLAQQAEFQQRLQASIVNARSESDRLEAELLKQGQLLNEEEARHLRLLEGKHQLMDKWDSEVLRCQHVALDLDLESSAGTGLHYTARSTASTASSLRDGQRPVSSPAKAQQDGTPVAVAPPPGPAPGGWRAQAWRGVVPGAAP